MDSPQPSRRVRPSPLPQMNMCDPSEMWESMVLTDKIYSRDANMLSKHPNITPRMRSILLDWLSEVSELFKLHRDTFYFAVDFVDRYLSNQNRIQRHQLQLIGTSCLFLAAKIEEVYPPKITDLAYITDEACTVEDIKKEELVIMDTLKWSVYPITVNKWLSVFLQILSIQEKENNRDPNNLQTGEKFLISNYNATFFAQVTHLVDLIMLDIGSLKFGYDVLAASAIYHFTSEKTINLCTGFSYNDIKECAHWMTPFALAVRENGLAVTNQSQLNDQSGCNKQWHTADLTLLAKAHAKIIDLTEESDSANDSASDSASDSESESPPSVQLPPSPQLTSLSDQGPHSEPASCSSSQDQSPDPASSSISSSTNPPEPPPGHNDHLLDPTSSPTQEQYDSSDSDHSGPPEPSELFHLSESSSSSCSSPEH